jgi:hypothetical protein
VRHRGYCLRKLCRSRKSFGRTPTIVEARSMRACMTARPLFASNSVPKAVLKLTVRSRVGRLALVLLICAGCVGPFARSRCSSSCAVPVDECDPVDNPTCGKCSACSAELCDRCVAAGENCCCRIWCPIANCVEPIVCWPFQKVCHVLNFCAPDGFVGPPDVAGPGRFHPVPTHPVFEPVRPPMTYPADPAP